ncbi:hypothetical protein [Caballeronia sp. DA-9]|uniref:hypothetical protein n=1 Tax=Caballeronia sp. DA-9 TaxID=3436237 RepID=UPI003F66B485
MDTNTDALNVRRAVYDNSLKRAKLGLRLFDNGLLDGFCLAFEPRDNLRDDGFQVHWFHRINEKAHADNRAGFGGNDAAYLLVRDFSPKCSVLSTTILFNYFEHFIGNVRVVYALHRNTKRTGALRETACARVHGSAGALLLAGQCLDIRAVPIKTEKTFSFARMFSLIAQRMHSHVEVRHFRIQKCVRLAARRSLRRYQTSKHVGFDARCKDAASHAPPDPPIYFLVGLVSFLLWQVLIGHGDSG